MNRIALDLNYAARPPDLYKSCAEFCSTLCCSSGVSLQLAYKGSKTTGGKEAHCEVILILLCNRRVLVQSTVENFFMF